MSKRGDKVRYQKSFGVRQDKNENKAKKVVSRCRAEIKKVQKRTGRLEAHELRVANLPVRKAARADKFAKLSTERQVRHQKLLEQHEKYRHDKAVALEAAEKARLEAEAAKVGVPVDVKVERVLPEQTKQPAEQVDKNE